MHFTSKELDLAKKYANGDLTDVQLNYLAFQIGANKRKLKKLAEYFKSTEPFFVAAKLLLGFIVFHLLFCFFYSLYNVLVY
jgi:hypothetical protein